ncbi:metal-dependent phosphohydrolase [Spirochaetia bacterium]|nr:metal-dependent phosphohydrolase [Spirochaetia bacterium]
MMTVPLKSLRSGLIFSEPVYIDKDNILVPAGVAIRQKDLDQLVSWGINEVSTEGKLLAAAPAADAVAVTAAVKDASNLPVAKKAPPSLTEVKKNTGAYRIYISLIKALDVIFGKITLRTPVELHAIDIIITRMLQAIWQERDSIIGYILGGEVEGYELAKSSINAAILTTLTAQELKLPHHRILLITTAALLHDVGMLRIPRAILDKNGGLSNAELQRMQTHPVYTYQIISKELLYPGEVGPIALQHHERWDGEGYPRRISGEDIDIGARIISVVDAFEAMVSQKSYRNLMGGYQAMKSLLSDNGRRFDPAVLKAFIQTMGIHPIGSIVLLNNGAWARVIEVQKDTPLRPKLRILADNFGVVQQDEGILVNLLTEKHLYIVRAIEPKELAKKKA